MDHNLPITVTSKGLFEAGDKSSEFLMTKLEAWLNFKALQANWYGDEDLVLTINVSIMPEKLFLDNQVDRSLKWQSLSSNTTTALFNHNESITSFTCFLMLSNDELNETMAKPQKVEDMLQNKLATVANHFGEFYELNNI